MVLNRKSCIGVHLEMGRIDNDAIEVVPVTHV
jgi:hypothetical protein